MTDRRGTEFPWDMFGRRVRPVHAVLTASLILLAALQDADLTPLGKGWGGDLIGLLAGGGAALLTVGWWLRSDRLADWGLTFAAAAWAARAAGAYWTGTATFGTVPYTAALSACWAALAAGSWVLESADHRWRR